jgi:hypothetical protein
MKQSNALSVAVVLHTSAFIVKMQMGLTGPHWHSRPSRVTGDCHCQIEGRSEASHRNLIEEMAFGVSNDWQRLTSIGSGHSALLSKSMVLPSPSIWRSSRDLMGSQEVVGWLASSNHSFAAVGFLAVTICSRGRSVPRNPWPCKSPSRVPRTAASYRGLRLKVSSNGRFEQKQYCCYTPSVKVEKGCVAQGTPRKT